MSCWPAAGLSAHFIGVLSVACVFPFVTVSSEATMFLIFDKIRLDSIADSLGMHLGKFWEIVKDREAWFAADRGVT